MPTHSLLARALTVVWITGWSAVASAAPDPAPLPPEIHLPTPSVPAGDTCSTLSSALMNGPVQSLSGSFLDDFSEHPLASGRWLPHYDGGWDAVHQRWLGADWQHHKRTLIGNQEQQIYVDPLFRGKAAAPLGLDPFFVSNGILSITASRVPPELQNTLYGYAFQSGLLISRPSLVQKYGYFEMRAQLPGGQALWPAFWMLPADRTWPPEIDILEARGQEPDRVFNTMHAIAANGTRTAPTCRIMLQGAQRALRTYGVLWTPERIVWYLDRRPIAQVRTPAGFDRPMYLLVNLAVGGNYVGPADDSTPLPAALKVDHIAAWQWPGHPPCNPRTTAAEINRCPALP